MNDLPEFRALGVAEELIPALLAKNFADERLACRTLRVLARKLYKTCLKSRKKRLKRFVFFKTFAIIYTLVRNSVLR